MLSTAPRLQMNKNKILVSYFIERGSFSKSKHKRSLCIDNGSTQSEMAQIRARLSLLHDKDARIIITNIEAEKDIPNNPFARTGFS